MTDNTPTPVPSAAPPSTGLWIPVSHQLVRRHDGSVISSHCCSTCGMQALQDLTLAGIIGPDSPGPLEEVWVDLIDVATSQPVAFTWGLTPLNGEPTDVYSWP